MTLSNKDSFDKRKHNLSTLIEDRINAKDISAIERSSLLKLRELIREYTFLNRFEMKGILSHTIVDSLTLDYSLASQFIEFDEAI